jgi:hypothetical protein
MNVTKRFMHDTDVNVPLVLITFFNFQIYDWIPDITHFKSGRAPDNFQVLLLKMMRICIFPLHCCTLYFRKDCLHVHF